MKAAGWKQKFRIISGFFGTEVKDDSVKARRKWFVVSPMEAVVLCIC